MEKLSRQPDNPGDILAGHLMSEASRMGNLDLARTVRELRAEQVAIALPERHPTNVERLKLLGRRMLSGFKGSQAQVFEFPIRGAK